MPRLTSRQRVQPFARQAPFRDASLIIIATEGRVTEPHYFSLFDQTDALFFNPRVRRIDVLASDENGLSAPRHVLNRLLSYKQTYDITGTDQLWLVVDFDRWQEQGVLDPVLVEALQHDVRLAVSNPNFEVWLLCHHLEVLPGNDAFRRTCKEVLGNTKVKFDLEDYRSKILSAIELAKKMDDRANVHYPSSLGTRVYQLVEVILPAEYRRN